MAIIFSMSMVIVTIWCMPSGTAFFPVHLTLLFLLLIFTLFVSKPYADRLPVSFEIKPAYIAAICLVLGVLFFWMNFDYVKGISGYIACPWSDPTAYYTQARMFAAGHLSAPSPPGIDCFESEHCVNYHGRFFGKYPPGWPALLAIGLKCGLPWIVNPLLTIASLFFIYLFARRFFDSPTALIAFLFACTSNIIHWGAKSYFSEPLALLSLTVFLYYSLRALLESKWTMSIPAGIALGMLFLTRPSTAFVICIPIGVFWVIESLRDPGALFRGAVLAACALPFFLLHLAYNQHLAGAPFIFPHSLYCVYDRLGFGLRTMDNCIAPVYYGIRNVPRNIVMQLVHVAMLGAPLSPLLLGALFLRPVKKIEMVLVGIFICFLGFHTLFHTATVRYHMPAMAAIAVGSAAGLIKIAGLFIKRQKAASAAVVVALVISCAYLISFDLPIIYICSVKQTRYMDPFIKAKKERLQNAIVVMRSTPMHGTFSLFYTQNAPDFDNNILFLNNCTDLHSLCARHYPERKVYYYDYDTAQTQGCLTALFCP